MACLAAPLVAGGAFVGLSPQPLRPADRDGLRDSPSNTSAMTRLLSGALMARPGRRAGRLRRGSVWSSSPSVSISAPPEQQVSNDRDQHPQAAVEEKAGGLRQPTLVQRKDAV